MTEINLKNINDVELIKEFFHRFKIGKIKTWIEYNSERDEIIVKFETSEKNYHWFSEFYYKLDICKLHAQRVNYRKEQKDQEKKHKQQKVCDEILSLLVKK